MCTAVKRTRAMKAARILSAVSSAEHKRLSDVIRTVYVENYDLQWGGLISSGVDVWLNNPMRPQEASGTSGMKAAMNGVPSFSVLDGWWVEGHIEGVTGWSIGDSEATGDPAAEVRELYDKLEHEILPLYYGGRLRYIELMRSTIALNGSFFNTQRMVQQYVSNAYLPRNSNHSYRQVPEPESAQAAVSNEGK